MTGDEMEQAIEFLLRSQAKFESRFERIEAQAEETNRQIAHTNQVVEALAETQTEFTQTVLGFITSQNATNESFQKSDESCRKDLDELKQAILELTRTVNNFINFSSGNGNSPRE